MEKKYARFGGFTLIELMIVVTILGILASVAVQKYAGLMMKAKEASTKGDLGVLRSCVGLYYARNEALYPATLTTGLIPDHIERLPSATLSDHLTRKGEVAVTDDSDSVAGWVYPDINSASHGRVWVNCTHFDTQGLVISSW